MVKKGGGFEQFLLKNIKQVYLPSRNRCVAARAGMRDFREKATALFPETCRAFREKRLGFSRETGVQKPGSGGCFLAQADNFC